MVRLSHGHIRIGSFQRLAAIRDEETMRRLVAYTLRHYFGETPGDEPEAQLLAHVVAGTARLAASYMAAGFVHGVLNSDNINVTAESFDYGPWRFTPQWEPGFTAAYFDHQGLYAFGRQAQAIHWDVVQLAIALRLLASADVLAPPLDEFPAIYEAAFRDAIFERLGIASRGETEDLALLQAMETALTGTEIQIDRFFFDWAGGRRRGTSPDSMLYAAPAFADFVEAIAHFEPTRTLDHPYWSDPDPCSMHIAEVEAIWDEISSADRWDRFEAKVAAIRRMGEAMRDEPSPIRGA
jgi:uncharacterized protein YdiU (UPF0061 family)